MEWVPSAGTQAHGEWGCRRPTAAQDQSDDWQARSQLSLAPPPLLPGYLARVRCVTAASNSSVT